MRVAGRVVEMVGKDAQRLGDNRLIVCGTGRFKFTQIPTDFVWKKRVQNVSPKPAGAIPSEEKLFGQREYCLEQRLIEPRISIHDFPIVTIFGPSFGSPSEIAGTDDT